MPFTPSVNTSCALVFAGHIALASNPRAQLLLLPLLLANQTSEPCITPITPDKLKSSRKWLSLPVYDTVMPMVSGPYTVLMDSTTVTTSALSGAPSKTNAPADTVADPDRVAVASEAEVPELTIGAPVEAGEEKNWFHCWPSALWSTVHTSRETRMTRSVGDMTVRRA